MRTDLKNTESKATPAANAMAAQNELENAGTLTKIVPMLQPPHQMVLSPVPDCSVVHSSRHGGHDEQPLVKALLSVSRFDTRSRYRHFAARKCVYG